MGTSRYSKEFKLDAVGLVASTDRSINSVTKELGVNTESLRKWVRASEAVPSGGDGVPVTPSNREELE